MATPDIDTYRRSIRAPIRGYWAGQLTQAGFVEAMESAIHRGITQAWIAGAAECGITLQDLTPEERAALALFINNQMSFISGLELDIASGSKENEGLLRAVLYRADLWANKWNEAKTTAAAMACKDAKREWVLGPTKEKCKTCLSLAGRVYRYSVWLANVVPPSSKTQCRGWRCLCSLQETTKPITKGKFPTRLLAK
jgi:hypothetical protein